MGMEYSITARTGIRAFLFSLTLLFRVAEHVGLMLNWLMILVVGLVRVPADSVRVVAYLVIEHHLGTVDWTKNIEWMCPSQNCKH